MNIPGYYYDAVKRRYFKVENSKTAPTNAAWASDSVKRRKLHDEDAAAALQHLNIAKARIRRARVLHEPLTGGFFAREYGAMEDDMQAACFVEGLKHKGCIPLLGPGAHDQTMQVKHMFIAGHDRKTGMCNVYAAPTEDILLSTYLPRDKNGRLNQRLLANYRIPGYTPPGEGHHIPQISDIQYFAPGNAMFVTSRQPGDCENPNSLRAFWPKNDDSSDDPLRPRWLVPSRDRLNLLIRADGNQKEYAAHCVAPAPAASSAVCAVGTSRGIAQWGRGLLPASTWFAPEARSSTEPRWPYPRELFYDVFAIDFHPSHGEILRFGGRPGALFTADTRAPSTTWSYLKLPSAIAHLKCLDGGNQVLVAGLKNQLGVYDLRFARTCQEAGDDSDRIDIDDRDEDISRKDRNRARNSRGRNFRGRNRNDQRAERSGRNKDKTWSDHASRSIAQPVIQFEHYRNTAHIDIGFAYDAPTGVVATAHDDIPGTVALYSVRTGSRLRVLDLASTEVTPDSNDEVPNSRSLSRHVQPTSERRRIDHPVIQSLQFQTFPGDRVPTLFAGSGPRSGITAFTFGVDDLIDEA
ncbi:hypothetical protein F5Y01DRAFT_277530 [Xylaria sp. FL0043]|nr:hypothetical protein F5Y01DRAFT_277530 [Xylaria sp. FL0043]